MKSLPFPGSCWITDHLLLGDASTDNVELTPAILDRLFAAGVRCVVHLLSKEQFLAAGPDVLFGPLAEVLDEPDFVSPPGLELHYCFWPLADETPPTTRQIRLVVDTIDRALSAGLSIFLHGAGNPRRSRIAADCWLAHQKAQRLTLYDFTYRTFPGNLQSHRCNVSTHGHGGCP